MAIYLRFYAPSNLDLIKLLTDFHEERWIPHAWKLYYVMTVVYRHRWNKARDENGYAPVSAVILQKHLGSRFSTEAKKILLKLGILETDNQFIKREKCKGYRFKEPYQSARFRQVAEIDPKTVSFYLRQPGILIQIENAAHALLRANLERLTIDGSVDEFLRNFQYDPKKGEQVDYFARSVEWIQTGYWFFKPCPKTGRVFNNITSLPRGMRQFLRIDGRPLIEIDVANCQPLLLIGLYEGEPEREAFKQAVQNGTFYEFLDAQLEKPFGAERRKELKEALLTVLFDKIRPNESRLTKAFKNTFPVLYGKITEFKTRGHEQLALRLQSDEAKLMIQGVVGEIADTTKIPVLTVHDSILTLPEYGDYVRRLIAGAFNSEFGFVPKLKEKDYSGGLAVAA